MQLTVGRAIAQIVNTYAAPGAVNQLEWTGSRGTAVPNYFDKSVPELSYRVDGQSEWTVVDCGDLPGRFLAQTRYFVECVRQGRPPSPNVQHGLRINEIVAQAYNDAARREDLVSATSCSMRRGGRPRGA